VQVLKHLQVYTEIARKNEELMIYYIYVSDTAVIGSALGVVMIIILAIVLPCM